MAKISSVSMEQVVSAWGAVRRAQGEVLGVWQVARHLPAVERDEALAVAFAAVTRAEAAAVEVSAEFGRRLARSAGVAVYWAGE